MATQTPLNTNLIQEAKQRRGQLMQASTAGNTAQVQNISAQNLAARNSPTMQPTGPVNQTTPAPGNTNAVSQAAKQPASTVQSFYPSAGNQQGQSPQQAPSLPMPQGGGITANTGVQQPQGQTENLQSQQFQQSQESSQNQQIQQPAQQGSHQFSQKNTLDQTQVPTQLDQKAIAADPYGYKQFQQQSAQQGYVYDDQGKLVSSKTQQVFTQTPQVDPMTGQIVPPPDVNSVLHDETDKSFDGQLEELLGGDPSTSSASLLKQNLIAQLGAIDDPSVNEYLDTQEQRAKAAYAAGINLNKLGADEIQKAMAGKLEAPETSEGLATKVAKEAKDQSVAATQAQQEYLQKSHELEMQQMRSQRADVEGYAKAMLGAIGATESSAGVTLMNKVTSQTDLLIEKANTDFNYAQIQLNQQSTKVQSDFANQVAGLAVQNNQSKMQVLGDYNVALSKIDDNRFANEQQKRQQKVAAFNDYTNGLIKSQQDFKTFALDAMKFAYQKHQDLQESAFKMSGMMGSIYMPGPDGQLIDTGAPTLESKKNAQDFYMQTQGFSLDQAKFGFEQTKFDATFGLDYKKYQLDVQKERGSTAEKVFQAYKDSNFNPDVAAQMEQYFGLNQGELSPYSGDVSGAKSYIQNRTQQASVELAKMQQNSPQIITSDAVNGVFNIDGKGGQCGDWASTISTATHVGNTWQEKKSHIDKIDNPQPGDKLLIPVGVKTDGSGWGHVAVVTGFNPDTGDISVVHSNWDLKGTISTHTFNVNKLNQQYKVGGWGYASGQFKSNIASKLQSLQPQELEQQIYTPPGNMSGVSGSMTSTAPYKTDWTSMTKSIQKGRGTQYTDQQISTINNLKADYKNMSTEVRTLETGYSVAKNFDVNTTNPYDDQALIFSFMKVLDPGSVVREGEFKTAQTNASFLDGLTAGVWQSAITGKGLLLPDQRQKILNTMEALHMSKMRTYEPLLEKAVYQGQAVGINDPKAYLDYTPEDINPEKAVAKEQTNNVKSTIAKAKVGNASSSQIIAGLMANPTIAKNVQAMMMQGAQFDDIINYYSQ